MYRLHWFYKTLLQYSWEDAVQDLSIRALGPALHFRRSLPSDLTIPLLLRSAIPLDGIEFTRSDPFAEIRGLAPAVQKVITRENRCFYCHAIGTRSPRAHHMRASDGAPQGGYGLPLTAYREDVMKAFIHNQTHVAEMIGMSPNRIADEHIATFEAWLEAGAPTQPPTQPPERPPQSE